MSDVYYVQNAMATILNYVEFDSQRQLNCREGSDKDADAVYDTFVKLGCTFYSAHCDDHLKNMRYGLRNGTTVETLTLLHALFNDEELKNHDCLVIVVASHGELGCFATYDGFINIREELISRFDECLYLKGKPKLFFIQACRSENVMGGLNSSSKEVQAPYDIISESDLPVGSDILISYSTIPGKYSYRHPNIGTWFLDELSKSFNRYAPTKNLSELMMEVNDKVVSRCTGRGVSVVKQCTSTVVQLRRTVKFGRNPTGAFTKIKSNDASHRYPRTAYGPGFPVVTVYLDRDEDIRLKEMCRKLCLSSDPGILFIYGDPGVGKTTLVARITRNDRHFLADECLVDATIWLNLCEMSFSNDFQERDFYGVLMKQLSTVDLSQQLAAGTMADAVLVQKILNKHRKMVLVILDDVFSKRVLRCATELGDYIRFIAVSRDKNIVQFNNRSLAKNQMKVERNLSLVMKMFIETYQLGSSKHLDDEQINKLATIDSSKHLSNEQISKLATICEGLPLLASVISSQFADCCTKDQSDAVYQNLVRNVEKSLLSLPVEGRQRVETTLAALLTFVLSIMQDKLKFLTFLLFPAGKSISMVDLRILWNVSDAEVHNICQTMVSASLLAVTADGYFINKLLQKAACCEALRERFLDARNKQQLLSGILERLIKERSGSNCLTEAIRQQRRELVEMIVSNLRYLPDVLAKLALQSDPPDSSETALLLLLKQNWVENEETALERNEAAELFCRIAEISAKTDFLATVEAFKQRDKLGESILDLLKPTIVSDGRRWHANYFLVAAKLGCEEVAKVLVEHGFEFDIATFDCNGDNALTIASRWGSADFVRFLVETCRFDVNSRNLKGETALINCVKSTMCEVIAAVLFQRNSLDVNLADSTGQTPLMAAARNGHLPSAVRLMGHLIDAGANIHVSNRRGCNALVVAAWEGKADAVKLLISRGAFIDNSNWDRVMEGVRIFGYQRIERLLFDSKLEMGQAITKSQKLGLLEIQTSDWSDLHSAAFHGRLDDVNAMSIEDHLVLNARNDEGNTPLALACLKGHLQVVKRLVSVPGIDIDLANHVGDSPLILACRSGYRQIAESLVRKGANIIRGNQSGNTPLIVSCFNCHPQLAEFLVDQNAPIDAVNHFGNSSLMLACKSGRCDIAKMLIESGANIGIRNHCGKTALGFAKERQMHAIEAILREQGLTEDSRPFISTSKPFTTSSSYCSVMIHLQQAVLFLVGAACGLFSVWCCWFS